MPLAALSSSTNPDISCTSLLAFTVVDSVLGPALRSPKLAARLSSLAEYRVVCAFDDHREFLRITEVTERISEHNMCLFDTASSTFVPISLGDVAIVRLQMKVIKEVEEEVTRHDFARIHRHVRATIDVFHVREAPTLFAISQRFRLVCSGGFH